MYYYSLYQAHYLKFTIFHVMAFMLTGPVAAAMFGFIEVALLYLPVLLFLADALHWFLFHAAYVLVGLATLPILMKIRRYHRAEFSDVYGRFPKRNSVWP